MDTTIIEPTSNVDFTNKIYLGTPSVVSSGIYFTPIFLNDKPIIIQSPTCTTKQGIKNGTGKKMYTDLIFNSNDVFFINWMENLESASETLISNMDWFEKKIDREELETMFVSCFKLYKSGKKYLFRASVKPNVAIYDQTVGNGNGKILKIEDIEPDLTTMICILEIKGIKFTSQSFQFDIEVKQIALVSPDPYLDTCFVKIPMKNKQELFESKPLVEEKTSSKIITTLTGPLETVPLNDVSNISESLDATSTATATATATTTHTSLVDNEMTDNEMTDNEMSLLLSQDDINEVKQSLNVSFNPDVNVQTIPATKSKKNNNKTIKAIEGEEGGENMLEFEDMNPEMEKENENGEIKEIMLDNLEVHLENEHSSEKTPVNLKKPEDIYCEMFNSALEKANLAKQHADQLYLEANEIREKYGLKHRG